MLADAARGKKNFRVHPLQRSLANAPKSANCHVHVISAIFFDPADHYLTIFQKKFKKDLIKFFEKGKFSILITCRKHDVSFK
jgi:hypothetical protein